MFKQLSRVQLFAMTDQKRSEVYLNRRVNAMIAHAKWSATHYANLLLSNGVVDTNGAIVYHGRYGWTRQERLAFAGGDKGIRETMRTHFQVADALLDMSTRVCIKIVETGDIR